MPSIQSMLSAIAFGDRVTIGREPIQELRRLSDARALRCPLCEKCVVLKAGTILAPHFAHLPGVSCSHHDAEPETPRHREGKALLARWIRARLPDSDVTLEAVISETGQRADLLLTMMDGRRVALEYQCADLSARDWRRRRDAYQSASILDLWILGGNRLVRGENGYRVADLERAMLEDARPLLILDSLGENLPSGHLARLRPKQAEVGTWIQGSVSARPIEELDFPWRLLRFDSLDSVARAGGHTPYRSNGRPDDAVPSVDMSEGDAKALQWLRLQHGISEETLPEICGLPVRGTEAFACSPCVWQACVYYRWLHGHVGEAWRLDQVVVWARRHLPLAIPTGNAVMRALGDYQDLLAAAGLLSMPQGAGRARVEADLTTLGRMPDLDAAQRIAGYRRTIRRN